MCAAREERSPQREYRGAVRDNLFISAKYEMVAHSIASRATDLIRGRSVILAKLSRSNIPDEITKSEFERRAYEPKERADAVLQPLEHRFQEYLEEFTNTARSTRTLQ